MSYLALARKWRPKIFAEVVGQDHVVSALTNAVQQQRIHHAFLFTGTRGVGKTTLARIFAKTLNCTTDGKVEPCGECNACQSVDAGNFVDLIEVDAASRTRVDDTRELLDNVQYTPTSGQFKIYLIDEVHMLSMHSFNALLKTLEEPPPHVKFLLATTNPQKLPTTVLSRCIQFNLKTVDIELIAGQLEKILRAEKIAYGAAALTILARAANGSVRDALSLLDQAIAFSNGQVEAETVRTMLGMIDGQLLYQLLQQVIAQDATAALATVASIAQRAVDYAAALDELLSLIHNVALYQISPQAVTWKGLDGEALGAVAATVDAELLQLFFQIGMLGKRDFAFAPEPRAGFEMVLIRMLAFQPQPTNLSPAAQAPAVATTVAPHATATAAAVDAVMEPAPSPAADPTAPRAHTSQVAAVTAWHGELVQLLDADQWCQFIDQSGVSGISRELLMNMTPQKVDGQTLHVVLEFASRHLFNETRQHKIEQCCKNKLAMDFQLAVTIAELSEPSASRETPTRTLQRKHTQQQADAKQAFAEDANVQELMTTFGATIDEGSVKPPSA